MKLGTMIPARRDGTLKVEALAGGVVYEFTRSADGDMQGDVKDERTVTHLLATERFYPVQEKDVAKAQALLDKAAAAQAKADGTEAVDEDGDPNALPVEGKGAAPTA